MPCKKTSSLFCLSARGINSLDEDKTEVDFAFSLDVLLNDMSVLCEAGLMRFSQKTNRCITFF